MLTPREWVLLVCLTDPDAHTGISVEEGIEAALDFVARKILALPRTEGGTEAALPAPPAPRAASTSAKPPDPETAARNKQYRALRDLNDAIRRST